jgi:hypothetical protein
VNKRKHPKSVGGRRKRGCQMTGNGSAARLPSGLGKQSAVVCVVCVVWGRVGVGVSVCWVCVWRVWRKLTCDMEKAIDVGGWLEVCVTVRRHPIFLFIVGVILVMVHKGLSVLSLVCSVRVCECVCVCVSVCVCDYV